MRVARAGANGRVLYRAALDARHSRGDADHQLGMEDAYAAARLVDEVLEHVLGDDVIRDHAVAHRTERGDRSGGATEHQARLLADRDDPRAVRAILVGQLDDRRFGEDDPLPPDV